MTRLAFLSKTSLWTMAFSTTGGVAGSDVLANSLTVAGSIAAVGYAVMSAVVGYCTKLGMDYLFEKIKRHK